jgi:hypothetical protein
VVILPEKGHGIGGIAGYGFALAGGWVSFFMVGY